MLVEKDAGFAVDDSFEGAAFSESDDGGTGGLGFDGDDAEIFEGGEDEAFCGIVGFCDFGGVVWVESDGGAG